jgi:hypothetical protein
MLNVKKVFNLAQYKNEIHESCLTFKFDKKKYHQV